MEPWLWRPIAKACRSLSKLCHTGLILVLFLVVASRLVLVRLHLNRSFIRQSIATGSNNWISHNNAADDLNLAVAADTRLHSSNFSVLVEARDHNVIGA